MAPASIPPSSPGELLLEVEDLRTSYFTEEGELRAVDGVSFELRRGRTLAVVGESGCGKSAMAHSLLRLVDRPGKIVGGSVRLHGPGAPPVDIAALREGDEALYRVRGGRVGMIFQESTAALSPVHSIGSQMLEAIKLHGEVRGRQAFVAALDMLERVGLADPELCMRQYPHQMSGGMRQRAGVAMALVAEPELLIADEPTTALDATTQIQVLGVLKKIQAQRGMAILLITHDLSVVAQMAEEVVVMYLGRIVERASVRALLKKPRHPYTMGLLSSLPSLTPAGQRLPSVEGSVPSLAQLPAGCAFHPRCPHAEPGLCDRGGPPPLEEIQVPSAVAGPGAGQSPKERAFQLVACRRVREVALSELIRTGAPPRVAAFDRAASPEPVASEQAAPAERSAPAGRAAADASGNVSASAGELEVRAPAAGQAAASEASAPRAEPELAAPQEAERQEESPLPASVSSPAVAPPSRASHAVPRFMSSTRPRSSFPPESRRGDAARGASDRDEASEPEHTLPLPLAAASALPPTPGERPPPHTLRPEPFGRASQPPPSHVDRSEPFGRASQPPHQPFGRASQPPAAPFAPTSPPPVEGAAPAEPSALGATGAGDSRRLASAGTPEVSSSEEDFSADEPSVPKTSTLPVDLPSMSGSSEKDGELRELERHTPPPTTVKPGGEGCDPGPKEPA